MPYNELTLEDFRRKLSSMEDMRSIPLIDRLSIEVSQYLWV